MTGVRIFVDNFCLNNFTSWKTMYIYVPICSLRAGSASKFKWERCTSNWSSRLRRLLGALSSSIGFAAQSASTWSSQGEDSSRGWSEAIVSLSLSIRVLLLFPYPTQPNKGSHVEVVFNQLTFLLVSNFCRISFFFFIFALLHIKTSAPYTTSQITFK